jgi:hypothetical protein
MWFGVWGLGRTTKNDKETREVHKCLDSSTSAWILPEAGSRGLLTKSTNNKEEKPQVLRFFHK